MVYSLFIFNCVSLLLKTKLMILLPLPTQSRGYNSVQPCSMLVSSLSKAVSMRQEAETGGFLRKLEKRVAPCTLCALCFSCLSEGTTGASEKSIFQVI